MTGRLIIAAMLPIAFLCAALAAPRGVATTNINGKWHGEIPRPGHDTIEFTFDFKVDGEKLTGTAFINILGEEIPLIRGKVHGDTISFKIEGYPHDYEGIVSDNEIRMKQISTGGEFGARTTSFTLKRVPK